MNRTLKELNQTRTVGDFMGLLDKVLIQLTTDGEMGKGDAHRVKSAMWMAIDSTTAQAEAAAGPKPLTLKEWLDQKGVSDYDKQVLKHLRFFVVKEVSSARMLGTEGMTWDEYLRQLHEWAPFKAKYVFSYVVLENGYAVGLNENPGRGWTFPVVKYTGPMPTRAYTLVIHSPRQPWSGYNVYIKGAHGPLVNKKDNADPFDWDEADICKLLGEQQFQQFTEGSRSEFEVPAEKVNYRPL